MSGSASIAWYAPQARGTPNSLANVFARCWLRDETAMTSTFSVRVRSGKVRAAIEPVPATAHCVFLAIRVS
jgi:hypothetical protein